MNLAAIIQQAQAFSPVRLYQPEQSPDFPMLRALVAEVDTALEAVTPQTNLVLTGTISTSTTVGPTSFHTVSGNNTLAGGFILLMYAENSTGAPSGGTLNFTINWTRNGGGESDMVSISLGAGTSCNYNGGYYLLNADIGTDFTWEYTTTITGGETANVRLVAALIQLY